MLLRPFVALSIVAVLCCRTVMAYSHLKMLCLVNRERAKYGLPPLGDSAALTHAAQYHSNDQASMDSMIHRSSNGEGPTTRLMRFINNVLYTAENIAPDAASEEEVFAMWMGSPIHARHILSPKATHTGSAMGRSRSNKRYYTQDFSGDGKRHNFPICPGEEESYSAYDDGAQDGSDTDYDTSDTRESAKQEVAATYHKVANLAGGGQDMRDAAATDDYPREWTCIKTDSNGRCHRWKKCTVDGSKWDCTEKWVGHP
ncbi:hypothetical protein SYNPS1DRAFT_28281 [Syncephalis pseudoplumigaleata]|uniref:SCP domain-containing protein n=1 Tax=Syncephalis pseudoplumigaleata TaxID=1712513 RepID=A0A4P9Z206_9FUNG|nr:hypothetical protein SYNPS1DRAFT_28281 [Syncephalis pseudoplumigaleata]|eukprot:RKP26002.1 hypothetical protein SYNPS1DRAFT_28281 [Syncephalis pseudoplumigaleata]